MRRFLFFLIFLSLGILPASSDGDFRLRPHIILGPGWDSNLLNGLYAVRQQANDRSGFTWVTTPSLDFDYLSPTGVNIRFNGGVRSRSLSKNHSEAAPYGLLEISRRYTSWRVGARVEGQQFIIPAVTRNHFNEFRGGFFLERFFSNRLGFDLKSNWGKKTYFRRWIIPGRRQEDKGLDYEAGVSLRLMDPFMFRFFYGYLGIDSNSDTEDYRENRIGFSLRWKKHPPSELKYYFEYANLDFSASGISSRNFINTREDNRYRTGLIYTRRLLGWLDIQGAYRYIYNQSNDPAEVYEKHRFDLLFDVDFWALTHHLSSPIIPRPLEPPIPGRVYINGQTVTFYWKAPPGMRVSVAGNFNDWNINKNPLRYFEEDMLYKTDIHLSPGTYTYLFVVNQKNWMTPQNEKNFKTGASGKTVGFFTVR